MSVQRTEEGTFLQICSFPDEDVFLYVEMPLKVVERNSNISLYNRTVNVEDNSKTLLVTIFTFSIIEELNCLICLNI